jgi:hypothetical protein
MCPSLGRTAESVRKHFVEYSEKFKIPSKG